MSDEREAITGFEGQRDVVHRPDGHDIAVIRLEASANAAENVAAERSPRAL
jgi:hypothetical protein